MMNSKIVKGLLAGRSSYRGDCPSCGGRNTFSANRTLTGEVAWYCFKASCSIRGRADVSRSVTEIKDKFFPKYTRPPVWELPGHFTNIAGHEDVYAYLHNNNVLHAVAQGHIDCMYDPQQHRAVFIIRENNVPIDAVGRLLDPGKPKWYRYGNSDVGCWFINDKNHLVITEDVLSATVASYYFSSVALLGTELSTADFLRVITYPRVSIALDPDAYSKGVDIMRRLMPYTDARVVFIPDDLKYYEPRDAKDIINDNGATPITLRV